VTRKNKKVTKSTPKKKPARTKPGRIVLASRTCIKSIAELRDELVAAYKMSTEIVIDASKVESVDTASLQLLVAFVNSVRGQSRAVRWNKPSGEFRDMAALVDLSACLDFGDHSIPKEDDGLCPVF